MFQQKFWAFVYPDLTAKARQEGGNGCLPYILSFVARRAK